MYIFNTQECPLAGLSLPKDSPEHIPGYSKLLLWCNSNNDDYIIIIIITTTGTLTSNHISSPLKDDSLIKLHLGPGRYLATVFVPKITLLIVL